MTGNKWESRKKFYPAIILHKFSSIDEYYSVFSEYIKGIKLENENRIENLNLEDEDIKELYIDNAAENYRISKVIEENFCKSLLMSLYSFIEYNLVFICEKYDIDNELNKSRVQITSAINQ